MSLSDYDFASAQDLATCIKNRKVSSLELTDHYIDRIEKFDGEINAVVVHDFERARDAAKPVTASGLMTASVPPAIITSTRLLRRYNVA